ncbi:hypothetical protein PanWU01x14_092440, partial [Parasponia andersonii]
GINVIILILIIVIVIVIIPIEQSSSPNYIFLNRFTGLEEHAIHHRIEHHQNRVQVEYQDSLHGHSHTRRIRRRRKRRERSHDSVLEQSFNGGHSQIQRQSKRQSRRCPPPDQNASSQNR